MTAARRWPETISTARSRVSTDGLTPDRFGRLRGNLSIGFLDKPWIAVGPSPDDPAKDVLYVTYTEFDTNYTVLWLGEVPTIVPVATRTTIRMVRSEDGGRSWSTPVAVSPTVNQSYGETGGDAPGVFGTSRTVQGSQPAVAPDGSVYVAWTDSTDDDSFKGAGEIYVARSTDKGATFGSPVNAVTFNEIAYRPRNAFFRFWASQFPQLAIGPAGEIYIGYAAKPSDRPRDDSDIWLVKSTDQGQTFGTGPSGSTTTTPRRPSSSRPSTSSPDGTVHAMWGDMRDDMAQSRFNIYYTESEDGGETWGFEIPDLDTRAGDTRVTDFGSNPNRGFPGGRFLGDYFSLQATDDEVYMVWADTRLGEYGAPNMKIGFARQRSIPGPELFLSPSAGPGGQQVTLQGFGYQPEMNVFVQLGDSTVAMARTDETGMFTNVLYMPITSEGSQDLDRRGRVGQRGVHLVLHRVRLRQHRGRRSTTCRNRSTTCSSSSPVRARLRHPGRRRRHEPPGPIAGVLRRSRWSLALVRGECLARRPGRGRAGPGRPDRPRRRPGAVQLRVRRSRAAGAPGRQHRHVPVRPEDRGGPGAPGRRVGCSCSRRPRPRCRSSSTRHRHPRASSTRSRSRRCAGRCSTWSTGSSSRRTSIAAWRSP